MRIKQIRDFINAAADVEELLDPYLSAADFKKRLTELARTSKSVEEGDLFNAEVERRQTELPAAVDGGTR